LEDASVTVTFKVYLANPSIRAALLAPVTADDPAMGSLVETGIYAQWFHSDEELHYARWKGGEVDIVQIDPTGQTQWAVEVNWSDRALDQTSELAALRTFCRRNRLEEAGVTPRTARATQQIDGTTIDFTPASEYCYQLGRDLIRRRRETSSR